MKQPDIVGIGSSVYDTLMILPEFPKEDTKLEGLETKVQGGGPCATALVAAQKLGIPSAWMGTMGDDAFGRFMMQDFARWGVNTEAVRLVPGCVSFHSVVLLNRAAGSRTCIWNRGTVPPPRPEDMDEAMLRGAKVLHVDGHMLDAAVAMARKCRGWGVRVSYDAGGTYPGVERLLPLADWLIPSEEFALKVTGARTAEDAAGALWEKYHPEALVITQGVRGGLLMDEKGLRRYPAFWVDVVDSNGSGDTFHGAFAAAMVRGMNRDDACVYASAAAAIKCTRLGARLAMANDEECRAFLKERGVTLSL